jgi:hypothetical protein
VQVVMCSAHNLTGHLLKLHARLCAFIRDVSALTSCGQEYDKLSDYLPSRASAVLPRQGIFVWHFR